MKNKWLIITTIIFFLLVNTTYYWEAKLGLFVIPASLLLVLVFIILLIALLWQLFFSIKEKFANRQRIMLIVLITTMLAIAFFMPNGIIDFEKFDGKDILVAEREGSANCTIVFKLKENNRFTEKSICFGITETKGEYKITNDTIYFENVQVSRGKNEFYKFALMRPSKFINDNEHFDLVRYKDLKDSVGHELWITKNELDKQ